MSHVPLQCCKRCSDLYWPRKLIGTKEINERSNECGIILHKSYIKPGKAKKISESRESTWLRPLENSCDFIIVRDNSCC